MSEDSNQFESQMKQLSEIVNRLNQGDESLDSSLKLFQQGVALSHQLKAQLQQAQGALNQVVDDNDQTSPLN